MQITIEDISPVEKRVDFELPWADVGPRLDRAYDKLRREVHLKGFRPGKAPRSVLEKLYRDQVESDVARELVELSLGQAIQENQLQPVAPPTVDRLELESGKPLKFSARVEVRSQVTPKDYTGLTVKRRPPKVEDEQIQQALEGYRRQLTEYKPVEGRDTTAETDVLVVEVQGKIADQKIKKNTVMVDLADENAGGVPGLSARLRGVPVAAENLEVKYQIAADAPVLGGKDVSLRVTIKEARERKQPALDDEFAKDTGEADTLDELKKKIRERLTEQDSQRIKAEMSRELVKEIVKGNPFPLAPALVDRYAEAIVLRTRQQLVMAGMLDPEDETFDVARMKGAVKDEAEEQARASILLAAIAEREGLEVTDGDVQKRIAELAASRQESAKKLRADLERSGRLPGLRAQLREEKALDWLLAQAKVVDEDPDRLIITPDEARGGEGRLIVTPDEARAEAERK